MAEVNRWMSAAMAAVAVSLATVGAQAQPPGAVQAPVKIPPVMLSRAHEALCKVKVGDAMPAIELPGLDGTSRKLASLLGKKATVVVFWNSNTRMAREQLGDLLPDVVQPFGKSAVALVTIAVEEPQAEVQTAIEKAGGNIPTLIDADGNAFGLVGSGKLPRTYLLDPQGKVLWFDIEYSLGTRRDLRQALRAVAGEPAKAK